jgi:hypothetical protein
LSEDAMNLQVKQIEDQVSEVAKRWQFEDVK